MRVAYLLLVWLHLVAAMVWIGGTLFIVLVLVPMLRRPEWQGQAAQLVQTIGHRFRQVSWSVLLVLLATGVSNLFLRGFSLSTLGEATFWTSAFGRILAWKLALVGLILGLSMAHDLWVGPRATAAWRVDPSARETVRLRRAASWMGRVNLLLGLVVVLLGVMLVRGFLW